MLRAHRRDHGAHHRTEAVLKVHHGGPLLNGAGRVFVSGIERPASRPRIMPKLKGARLGNYHPPAGLQPYPIPVLFDVEDAMLRNDEKVAALAIGAHVRVGS